MRASTFFALFIAVLLGFAFLGAIRYLGWLNPTTPDKDKIAPKAETYKVLVAKRNLFENYAPTPADVAVRELRPLEDRDIIADYKKNPSKFPFPTPDAVGNRILKRAVEAGQVIYREDFQTPQEIPVGMQARLTPKTVAINVSVPKERAAGGMIRTGEFVDVYLTSAIAADKNDPNPGPRTACLARELCVILKRDNLFPTLAPVTGPIQFTLEANPYRAALIAFAKDKGLLTLVPTSKEPRLDTTKPPKAPESFSIADSKEYKNEDERVAAVLRSDRPVGDADLERIFGLPPLPIHEVVRIETMSGNKTQAPHQWAQLLPTDRPVKDPDRPGYGYHFSVPAGQAAVEPVPVVTPAAPAFPRPIVPKTK